MVSSPVEKTDHAQLSEQTERVSEEKTFATLNI